jgi:hypothetical protein
MRVADYPSKIAGEHEAFVTYPLSLRSQKHYITRAGFRAGYGDKRAME